MPGGNSTWQRHGSSDGIHRALSARVGPPDTRQRPDRGRVGMQRKLTLSVHHAGPIRFSAPYVALGRIVVAPPSLGTLAKARCPRQIVSCDDCAAFLRTSKVSAGLTDASLSY